MHCLVYLLAITEVSQMALKVMDFEDSFSCSVEVSQILCHHLWGLSGTISQPLALKSTCVGRKNLMCYIWTKNYFGTSAGVEGMTTDHKMYLSHVSVQLCPLHGVKATRNAVSKPNKESNGNHKFSLSRDSAAGYPLAFRN